MTTLAEHMIVAGAKNHPAMLDKTMYNSWQSRMLLYIKGKKNGRMMLESIENGPLVYPTIEENGQIRNKKYVELTKQEKLQDDCDVQAINIVLQGLPPDVYSLVNHCQAAKDIWDRVKLLMQGTELSYQEHECLAVLVFLPGADPIACLNKAMAFMSNVVASRFPSTNNQLRTSSNLRNQATIQDGRGKGYMARQCTKPKRLRNYAWFKEKMLLAQAHESGQDLDEEQLAFLANPGFLDGQVVQTIISQNTAFLIDDLDAYDSDCDDISSKKVLMANLSSYDSDVLSEVPQHDSYQNNDMINQSVQETQNFEQSLIDYVPDNEITSDSNLISYDQLNSDLSSHEKLIDSHMDDMIQNRNALKPEIDSLKQTLSKQVKEKESLLQTFTVFKKESKEKENKYMDKEIDLEKKIKELNNIVYKVDQSAQIVHMLTKPQVFYDDTHKEALGYQNPFYLKKAQRIKPMLYDGIVISKKHDVISLVDEEETLILEDESR
ncbi:hypothetical protein Tco_1236064 [Tanacetum coccineum]